MVIVSPQKGNMQIAGQQAGVILDIYICDGQISFSKHRPFFMFMQVG